jgi:hypothetical protein
MTKDQLALIDAALRCYEQVNKPNLLTKPQNVEAEQELADRARLLRMWLLESEKATLTVAVNKKCAAFPAS